MKASAKHQVTPSYHYGLWVGFNDVSPFQPDTSVVICTGSRNWSKPPRLGEVADVVAFDALRQSGTVVGQTMAVNYPIGARPQCVIRDGKPFYLINNIVNGLPCIDIYDHDLCHASTLTGFHHWCTTSDMAHSYCLDFNQTQRLGGYGYIFGLASESGDLYEYPRAVSAYCHESASHREVLSLNHAARLVADYLHVSSSFTTCSSYLTHLLLSPCESKLACLFRCWLRDGGLLTALLIVDLTKQVNAVHVELVGQLSHFMWLSETELVIYAYQILSPDSIRIRLNELSSLIPLSKAAKFAAKSLNRTKAFLHPSKSTLQSNQDQNRFSFQTMFVPPCFVTTLDGRIMPFDYALPISDGHPSVKEQLDRKLFVSDTYPNSCGERCIFVIDLSSRELIFRTMVDEYRPSELPVYQWVNRYSLLPAYAEFSITDQSFTRSGLHCDAHPFFNSDASFIGYHTSRNGYRTIELISL